MGLRDLMEKFIGGRPEESGEKPPVKVAVIGLDTSHSVALPALMQDPAEKFHVPELHATRALTFKTPFQSDEGLAERAKTLEKLGVLVTGDFDEAVADCDAILLEINDPAFHLEYFRKAAALGKPVFLDKPFADTLENAEEILKIARENHTRFFTASCLRFASELAETLEKDPMVPQSATVWGPVGKAPAGSSIVWYGVHAVEMLQRIMGRGAVMVSVEEDPKGYVAVVTYRDGRRGIVQLNRTCWDYGALLQDHAGTNRLIQVTNQIPFYYSLLQQIVRFVRDNVQVVEPADSYEVMAILDAMDRSARTGRSAAVMAYRE